MDARTPVLVTGATGKTGRAVCRRLAVEGRAVRALARNPVSGQALDGVPGLELVIGDLLDAGSLVRAARGARAIYHICPNVHPREVEIGRRVIAAAREAGIGHLVFHSVLHPQCEAMPHHWRKLRVEEMLLESGLPFTVLQPTAYMQNLLGGWRSIVDEGVYRVPYRVSARVALVDLEDVAEVAARVLADDGHRGATYELCSPDQPDSTEIAVELGRALGRGVRAASIPLAAWADAARSRGLDEPRIETLSKMFRYYDRHGMSGSPVVLRALLGREPNRLAELLRRAAADDA